MLHPSCHPEPEMHFWGRTPPTHTHLTPVAEEAGQGSGGGHEVVRGDDAAPRVCIVMCPHPHGLGLMSDGHINSHWATSLKSQDHIFVREALTWCLAEWPGWVIG